MSLGARPTKHTESGLSKETDEFLTKLMKKNGMSIRKQKEMKETIQIQGSLPLPPKPKVFKQETKPKPEQKVFTMARIGKKPLTKQLDQILEDTKYYEPELAPSVPVGPSSDEKKKKLAVTMYGIDEEEIERKKLESIDFDAPVFTIKDQIITEVQDRTSWLEQLHELGVHDHDGETIRQIEMRLNELRSKKE